MLMLNSSLAFFAKVKICTDCAFVSNTNDSFMSATVTVNPSVNNCLRPLSFLLFFYLWLLGKGLFSNNRLIFNLIFLWNFWSVLDFFRNFWFDFGDDFWHQFSKFILNEWIINMRFLLILSFLDLWYFFLNEFNLFNLRLNLYLICHFDKWLTVFPNGNFNSF